MYPVITGLAVDGGRIFILIDQGELGFLILEFTPDGTLTHRYTFDARTSDTKGLQFFVARHLETAETKAGRRFITGGNDLSSEYIIILRVRQIAARY